MSNEPTIAICGNAMNVELRFSSAGKAFANFRLASTPRRYDKQTSEWVDGETLWLDCSIWGQPAENLVETMGDAKSLRVIVQGRLKSRSYDDREGNKRTVFEVDVDEVGPSLARATAVVTRATGGAVQSAPRQPAGRTPAADPWAGARTDEPPF